jgi:hypothetical protein
MFYRKLDLGERSGLFSTVLVLEYVSVIFLRSAQSISVFPRFTLLVLTAYHLYLFSTPTGYYSTGACVCVQVCLALSSVTPLCNAREMPFVLAAVVVAAAGEGDHNRCDWLLRSAVELLLLVRRWAHARPAGVRDPRTTTGRSELAVPAIVLRATWGASTCPRHAASVDDIPSRQRCVHSAVCDASARRTAPPCCWCWTRR